MPFNRPTLNALIIRIENDIISRLTGGIPLLSRALLKIMARVFAGGFDSVYGNQEFISLQITVGTASEEWLRRYAFQWGVPIQNATFATGTYQFTGVNTTTIPLGTILVRGDDIEYITTTTGDIIGGVYVANITCRTAGEIGNAPFLTPLFLDTPIVGITTQGTILSPGTEGGVDGDTTEDIRANVLNRMQFPPMGGSTNDYKVVAEGVAGVERAFVFPNQAILGAIPGSVTVVIRGVTPLVPSAGLLSDVLAALNDPTFKPTTATHYTAPIDPKTIDFTITIDPNLATIQNNIVTNLEEVFLADAFPGGTLLITHIQNAISVSGINNYVIDQILVEDQGSVPVDQDINFEDFEYPVIGNFTFNSF